MVSARQLRQVKSSPEEQAYLELLRTADRLTRGAAGVLKAEDLSTTQYNVLRILRGSPEGVPCGEIGRRLITREPDITRLLDRMVVLKLTRQSTVIALGGGVVLLELDAGVCLHRAEDIHRLKSDCLECGAGDVCLGRSSR